MLRLSTALLLGGVLALLAGCGDEDHREPTAGSQSLSGSEDQPLQGRVTAVTLEGTVTFRVLRPPSHGRVSLDAQTGAFRYEPAADFFGDDDFTFVADNPWRTSQPARVSLYLQPVNDAPTLDPIPDLQNSAYERDTRYSLVGHDIDGDVLRFVPIVQDPAIARASIDPVQHTLVIEPLAYGTTQVTVEVQDGQEKASRQFAFSVADVTKVAMLDGGPELDHAVVLVNRSDRAVELNLTHNAYPMMGSDEQMVAYVRAMPPVFAGEPFERKLWRFVRDNTYHWAPLSTDQWINDPWMLVSSLGWGFCGETAAAYVRLAQAAGYDARVEGLTGHVVPEIKIGERWQMYDPDLALYYRNRDGEIANVAELAADPTLITEPIDPVLDVAAYPLGYSDFIASFYASTANNYIADWVFLTPQPAPRPVFTLPAGAELVYPGRWTDVPIGYDAETPYEVPAFVQGSLTTPAGWTGEVPLPFRLVAVRGEGRVRFATQEFEIGSPELEAALRANPLDYDHLEIVEARSPVRIVMFMNALRYGLQRTNDVEVRGLDVWAIEASSAPLLVENKSVGNAAKFAKPGAIRP